MPKAKAKAVATKRVPESKRETTISEIQSKFGISGMEENFSIADFKIQDFKNRVLCQKEGIAMERYILINEDLDIMELGWDFNVYNPPYVNFKYEMDPTRDFIINKEVPVVEDADLPEEERLAQLDKKFKAFLKTNFLCVVWISIKDFVMTKKLLVFEPGRHSSASVTETLNESDCY